MSNIACYWSYIEYNKEHFRNRGETKSVLDCQVDVVLISCTTRTLEIMNEIMTIKKQKSTHTHTHTHTNRENTHTHTHTHRQIGIARVHIAKNNLHIDKYIS